MAWYYEYALNHLGIFILTSEAPGELTPLSGVLSE